VIFMTIPNLIKIEGIEKFAKLVSGKYFYILKKYNDREYLIKLDEDKYTEYNFIIPYDEENNIIFRIIGDIEKKKKYKAFFSDKVLIIYETEYYADYLKEVILKNSIELQEENKKIENLFNQLRNILIGKENIPIENQIAIQTGQSIIEIVKAEDRPIDQKQFNVFEELYKEANIQKRAKRIKLYETEKKVEEKEEEYGIKDDVEKNDEKSDKNE